MPERQSRRRARLGRFLILLLALVALAIVFRRPLFFHNFGVVDRDLVFRAAQPKSDLARLISAHGLRSILNLRGGSEADRWYANEVDLTRSQGVDFYDMPLSAVRRPSRNDLLRLIDLFDRCQYPLLIHCKWGSDRTGLACGLYRMVRLGATPDEALRSFSVRHGHFPIGGPERLQEPISEYLRWLQAQRLEHTAVRFRSWVEHVYSDDGPTLPLPPVVPGPRPQTAAHSRPDRR